MLYFSVKDFAPLLVSEARLIGLDVGGKKLGVALSDARRVIASPFKVMIRKNLSQDLEEINRLIKDFAISGIVMGYPITMKGEEGDACKTIEKFAKELLDYCHLPILLSDERFTTAVVKRALKESSLSRKKRDAIDDKLAASYLLQGVLDQLSLIKLVE